MAKLYLISPPKINLKDFLIKLEIALSTKKISVFQLRLKDITDNEIINNSTQIIKICQKYQVPFILNDRLDLALKVGANGVHLGGNDGDVKNARNSTSKDFIIGSSCYDSRDKIMNTAQNGANYVSLGAFFPSKTKQSQGHPTLELLKWCDDFINIPNVCIGGINDNNYSKLIENGADFIAVISYIWNHEKGVKFAIESLSNIN